MSEWQPISTAPFDDSEILVRLCSGHVRVAYHFRDSYGRWVSDADCPWGKDFTEAATHWMPLPGPPEKA